MSVHFSSEIRPVGRLTAVRLDADEPATLRERAEVIKREGPDVTGIRIADDLAPSVAADLIGNDRISLELLGEPRRGEANIRATALVLMERLNGDGAGYTRCEVLAHLGSHHEHGTDARLCGPGSCLDIQVVRAESGSNLWQTLKLVRRIRGVYTPIEPADLLRRTIEKKSRRTSPADRRSQVLALEAIDTANYVLAVVTREFHQRHGAWVSGLGYKAIWLVGPLADVTTRLDGNLPSN